MGTRVVLHLVSPASGEVVEAMARVLVAQLADVTPVRRIWQMVRKRSNVEEALAGVAETGGLVLHTLIDAEHRVAELYHIVNVPTIIWIDEQGRICRPHDAQFGTDTFTQFHHKRSEPYLEMIRAWVRTGEGAIASDEVSPGDSIPPRWT